MKYSRVTISLPTSLLEKAEQELMQEEESRSAFIRRLVEDALHEAEEKAAEEQWIRAYKEKPQTEDELAWADMFTGAEEDVDPWEPTVPWESKTPSEPNAAG